jgi:hypothetical protein
VSGIRGDCRVLWNLALLGALALTAAPAPAYYFFIDYLNGASVPEKFDLTALPNNTVTVFISENGPDTYAPNDSFNSVLTQVRQAALVWNGVGSSNLRVTFGGLENASTLQNTPGIDVVFEDLPPGIEGYGGPTSTPANPATAADGSQFIPIVRSTIHLNLNQTILPGPSYNETFLMTTLHELGHSLGLQHTFTSATMSQATTRATNLTHPLGADDVAAISVLYPNANISQSGSITGRITAGGNPVHLASVVAIRSGGDAVSAVTNPDGTYRIDGIPPGLYLVYVHTMPPDANIFGPWNADGSVAAPTGPVNSVFYLSGSTAGIMNPSQATSVNVTAGQITSSINISTAARPAVSLYDDILYSYLDNNLIGPVQPAFISLSAGAATVVGAGIGLGSNGQAPGLGVQFLGNSIPVLGIVPYLYDNNAYTAIQLNLGLNPFPPTGPQHAVFTTPDYMYVLPSGLDLTLNGPPTVSAASSNGDGTVTITGTTWESDTLLYFDGLPSSIQSLDPNAGKAVVVPPPGTNNQQAILSAYNSDGQSSQILQSASPVTWSYGNYPTPVITSITPSSLPAGAEASIDIEGSGFTFTPGLTTVGFGTSDVLVQRLFVYPTHLQVDVSVSPNAALSNPDVSVMAGFQYFVAPAGFQITPQIPGAPTPFPYLSNAVSGLTGAYPGAVVNLYGSNLAVGSAVPVVSIGGQPVTVLYVSAAKLILQLPALTPGPAILTLNNGAAAAFPITVNIDALPAGIIAIQNATGVYIDSTSAAHPGDQLIVTLSSFAPPGLNIANSRVQVSVGGISHSATQVNSTGSVYQVYFQMNPNDPLGQSEQLIVYLDGRSSYPATIPVLAAIGSAGSTP